MHVVQYDVISHLNISRWENFYHVKDGVHQEGIALAMLNKDRYIEDLSRLIEERGGWDDEKEIPELAKKEFAKVDREFGERYKRIKVMEMQHPLFPKILDVSQDTRQGFHYVGMEYVPGIPFLFGTAGLSPIQILGLVKDLADGLEYLHRHKILHRRIKSDNVFVCFEGTKPLAKFTSWGLAVPIEKAQNDRSGSRHYVAPEVLFQKQVNEQSDLWSLASLGYRAMTRQPAFPDRANARDIDDLVRLARKEKSPSGLKSFGRFQNAPEDWKVDRMEELFFELLKPDPEKRAFKRAAAVISFIREHWPRLYAGAPETSDTISVTI